MEFFVLVTYLDLYAPRGQTRLIQEATQAQTTPPLVYHGADVWLHVTELLA
jgi:gamma-glutamyl phosphate reductase